MKTTPITSAKEAIAETKKLKSVWSAESLLSLRTLIYCASLLERISKPKRQRNPSAWQKFFAKEIKAGSTPQMAADKWRQRKAK